MSSGRKIGDGHASAMFRAGLKELSQILPAFPQSIKPVEEMGLAGNPTQPEVSRQRNIESPDRGVHGPSQAQSQQMDMGMEM